ncbi:MAG TPA: MnhB domain-containing protein [Mycobacteriales bacterium]|nr:MnhB domain-containing protein [Mycobacteriales bacterium]
MSRRIRLGVFAVGACAVGTMLVIAFTGLPSFGTQRHPYGDRAVHMSVHKQTTSNVVSSVNFDQRATDTLGEEFILFTAVVGTLVLLRELREEDERDESQEKRQIAARGLPSTALVSYVMLGVTTLVGLYVVAHGHLSPGGGFQGGVVLATAIHLLYVGGGYAAIRRARPVPVYEILEALGAGGFVVLGLAGTLLTGDLLANVLPMGRLGDILSGGDVELLNLLVGVEVASAFIVVLSRFLEQYAVVGARRPTTR